MTVLLSVSRQSTKDICVIIMPRRHQSTEDEGNRTQTIRNDADAPGGRRPRPGSSAAWRTVRPAGPGTGQSPCIAESSPRCSRSPRPARPPGGAPVRRVRHSSNIDNPNITGPGGQQTIANEVQRVTRSEVQGPFWCRCVHSICVRIKL